MKLLTINFNDNSATIDFDSTEKELRPLIAYIFKLDPKDLKGFQDPNGVYFTLTSCIKNSSVSNQTFPYLTLVGSSRYNHSNNERRKSIDHYNFQEILQHLKRNNELSSPLFEQLSTKVAENHDPTLHSLKEFVKNRISREEFIDWTKRMFSDREKKQRPESPLDEKKSAISELNKIKQHLADGVYDVVKNAIHANFNSIENIFSADCSSEEKIKRLNEFGSFQRDSPDKSSKIVDVSVESKLDSTVLIHCKMEKVPESIKNLVNMIFPKLRTFQKVTLILMLNVEMNALKSAFAVYTNTSNEALLISTLKSILQVRFEKIIAKLNRYEKNAYDYLQAKERILNTGIF